MSTAYLYSTPTHLYPNPRTYMTPDGWVTFTWGPPPDPIYLSVAEFTGRALEGKLSKVDMSNPKLWTAMEGVEQEVICRVHARHDLPLGPGKPALKPKYPYGPQERRRYPIAR